LDGYHFLDYLIGELFRLTPLLLQLAIEDKLLSFLLMIA